jgi:glyoxylase-like metal-dependent hydrolase (beta-lactamase superfamily II)
MAAPRVHHINAATMCPIGARLVNGPGHAWTAPGRMVCHCLLVETEVGLVLVDTGIGTEDVRDPAGRLSPLMPIFGRPRCDIEECAVSRVRQLGFRVEDVRHLVPTHLDLDHAGGLPDFPAATVHIHEAEHAAAMNPRTLVERERYRQIQWRHGPRWSLHAPGGDSWLGFQSVRPIPGCDDVLLIPLHGHTRGHCGVAVRTETGWVLHAGDAYFDHHEMDPRPTCSVALSLFQRLVAVDDELRRRNQRRLRALKAERPEVVLHCAHSGHEFDALSR